MAAKEKPGMRQLVVLLLLLLLAGEKETAGLTDDGMALIDVKNALHPASALKTWDSNLVNPCSWEGVTCLANSSVSTLLLQGKGLSGTLSPSIGKLSSLGTWRMGNNNISGELPGEIGQLQQLGFMDLGNNSFSGSIPVSLTGMLALNTLILEFNELSGSIPANLTSLPQLTRLDLSHNNLSGPVPEYRPGLTFDVTGNPLLQCGESPLPDCPGEAEAASSSGSGTGSSSKGSKAGVAAGAAAGGLAVLLAAGGGLLFWKKRREQEMAQEFFDVQDEQGPQIRYAQLREFTLRELNAATDQFSSRNVIGQGGFGKVFRGTLEDGSEVAVKRLNRDGHGGLGGGIGGNGMAGNGGGGGGGERAFQTEVEIISMAVHRNLLRLLGYCVTQAERILVYPFMRHGSVASRLRDSTSSSSGGGEPALDWAARRKIALGAARGLAYLHDFCQPKIIHRDVKAANVLLDDEMEAVVGDFGLAKLLDGSQTHITTMVRGTAGHIAPEYLTTGKSSEKTDVFGYGIMLLELLTGQRAFDFARLVVEDDVMLLDWVKRLEREGRQAELVDPNLRARYHPGQAQELIQVALLCTQASPGERPRMAEVVRMLEGDGLAERWQEWQRVELVRRRDSDHHLPRTLPQWVHDSTGNLDAIQLSSGR